jgi:hypothetical protein
MTAADRVPATIQVARVTYTEAGPGIIDAHSPGRETSAGVHVGTNDLIVLEIEETKLGQTAREYAEVAFSLAGATRLRNLLTLAIADIGASP